MSSLAQSAMSEGELSNSEEKEERRRSMESPSVAPHRIVRSSKSGTLPKFLEEKGSPADSRKWVELPVSPPGSAPENWLTQDEPQAVVPCVVRDGVPEEQR
jgi:hypothetical protein